MATQQPKQVETGYQFVARMAKMHEGQAKWFDKNEMPEQAKRSRRYAKGLRVQAASLKRKATKRHKTKRVRIVYR